MIKAQTPDKMEFISFLDKLKLENILINEKWKKFHETQNTWPKGDGLH